MARRSLPLAVTAAVVVHVPAPPVAGKGLFRASPKMFPALARGAKDVFRGMKRYWDHRDELTPPSGGQKTDEVKVAEDTAGLIIFNLSVGTPPQTISGILDITTPLVWSQCASCSACLPAPTFQPDQSPTFAAVTCGSDTCQRMLTQTCTAPQGSARAEADDQADCGYTGVYGEGTNTTGYLGNDTFTFGDISVPNLVFGCSVASVGDFAGASGVFGFSRGPLSLVSQLQLSRFSYFLASDDGDSQTQSGGGSSFFRFDGDEPPPLPTTTNSRSAATPLLSSPLHPEFYYVNLTGIRVARKDLVDIPAQRERSPTGLMSTPFNLPLN